MKLTCLAASLLSLLVAAPLAPAQDILWEQPPDMTPFGTEFASQLDMIYPFDCGATDDFEVTWTRSITHLAWWGGYWHHPGPLGPARYFMISILADEEGMPGDPVHEQNVHEWTVEDDRIDLFRCELDPVIDLAPGRYWLVIKANMFYEEGGQWGWSTSALPWGEIMKHGFPAFDIPFWTDPPDHEALAFRLITDQIVPSESRSWGEVKALYR